MFSSTVRLVGWSSTTSTRMLGMVVASPSPWVSDESPLPALTGSVKLKAEPTPGWLRTVIAPPISSTSWREIARPSPVPP